MAAADTLLVPEQWTYDGRFRDMSGLRCADAVKTSFDTGLLEGRQADRFDAVSELTNAQILVISARLYDRLTGGSGLAAPAVDPAQRLKLSFQSFSQCRDILGVDPAAVLLMVDGADFTAEDCSEALYQGLRKQ